MPAPYEIYANGLMDVYLAPANQADPAIGSAPPGAWIKLGVAGAQDYNEDGITVKKETENDSVYGLGSFGVRKVFRKRENLTIMLNLMDATIEAISAAFNQTAITVVVGPPAEKTIPLLEGTATPTFRALLIKGALSPYMDGGVYQWWIPIAYQTGSPEFVFKKSEPVTIAMEFTAVADATNGFGKIHAQTS